MTDQLPDHSPHKPSDLPASDGHHSDSSGLHAIPTIDSPKTSQENNGRENREKMPQKRPLFNRKLWNRRKKKLEDERQIAQNEVDVAVEIDHLTNEDAEVESREVQQEVSRGMGIDDADSVPHTQITQSPVSDNSIQDTYGRSAPADNNKFFSNKHTSEVVPSTPQDWGPATSQSSPSTERLKVEGTDGKSDFESDAPKKRILYVEDNPDNRLLISRILSFEGYEVVFAEDATETFEAIKDNTFDLILMDINLPDVDGYTVTNQLREITEYATVPILALTANVMKGDKERALEAGCDGYIQKPINIDTLPGQVKQYFVTR